MKAIVVSPRFLDAGGTIAVQMLTKLRMTFANPQLILVNGIKMYHSSPRALFESILAADYLELRMSNDSSDKLSLYVLAIHWSMLICSDVGCKTVAAGVVNLAKCLKIRAYYQRFHAGGRGISCSILTGSGQERECPCNPFSFSTRWMNSRFFFRNPRMHQLVSWFPPLLPNRCPSSR